MSYTRRRKYTLVHFFIDLVLTIITGGLWFVWRLCGFLRPGAGFIPHLFDFALSLLTGGLWLIWLIIRYIAN